VPAVVVLLLWQSTVAQVPLAAVKVPLLSATDGGLVASQIGLKALTSAGETWSAWPAAPGLAGWQYWQMRFWSASVTVPMPSLAATLLTCAVCRPERSG
jgi:hypothetical protein